MSDELSVAVLVERIEGLKELLISKFDENKVDNIRIQQAQDKTNGTVSGLVKWRSYMLGGMSVLTVIVIPLVFMVLEVYFKR